jgi:hypothetical protein
VQKIPLHHQFADLGVQTLDLPLGLGRGSSAAVERLRRLVLKLLLPRLYLIGMDLIALGQIGHRRLLAQRLQRYLRLQRPVDLSSRSLWHASLRLIRNGADSD